MENQRKKKTEKMNELGVEPGSTAWKAAMRNKTDQFLQMGQ